MQERSLGDILNETFAIFGKGGRSFALIAIVVFAPANLITFLGPRTELQHYVTAGAIPGSALFFYVLVALVTLVATTAVWSAASAAVGQQLVTGSIDVKECFKRVSWRLYSLLLLSFTLTIGLAICVGGIVIVIPAIVAAGFLLFGSLAIPAALYEGRKYVSALRRSFQLVRSMWPRILGGMILITLVMLGTGLVISVPSLLLLSLDSGSLSLASMGIQYLVSLIANSAAVTISAVAVTLLYFDTRIRLEGFGLEKLSYEISYSIKN